MPVKEYDPSSPARAVVAVLALAVSVIFAPGTIAPDSSVTMPRKVPVWANKADEKKSETKTPSNNFISQVPNLLPCKKYETKNPDVTTECKTIELKIS